MKVGVDVPRGPDRATEVLLQEREPHPDEQAHYEADDDVERLARPHRALGGDRGLDDRDQRRLGLAVDLRLLELGLEELVELAVAVELALEDRVTAQVLVD